MSLYHGLIGDFPGLAWLVWDYTGVPGKSEVFKSVGRKLHVNSSFSKLFHGEKHELCVVLRHYNP